jgi:ABC-type sugar transport system ATPase subunit
VITSTPALKVSNLSNASDFQEVSFTLHEGEVLCIFGKIGSGSAEVLESRYGLLVDK